MSRARKAYQYSTDEDSGPEVMDEEEQENVISALKKENDEKNELWIRYLLSVTVCSFLPFLPSFIKSSALQPKILAILGITSVFTTAYMLVFIPTRHPNQAQGSRISTSTPIQKYLPYLNGILTLLIGVNGLSWKDRMGVHDGFWILSWLPAVIFGMNVFARQVLVEVNPEELWGLKYELKGA